MHSYQYAFGNCYEAYNGESAALRLPPGSLASESLSGHLRGHVCLRKVFSKSFNARYRDRVIKNSTCSHSSLGSQAALYRCG
jgi:hypothetical protein